MLLKQYFVSYFKVQNIKFRLTNSTFINSAVINKELQLNLLRELKLAGASAILSFKIKLKIKQPENIEILVVL